MTLGMRVLSDPSQRGFSLIEVLVAITILLVGVLGVVAMVDGANAVTQRTKAREGATNVARSVIEVGRAVPYKDLDEASLLAALDSRPGLDDAQPVAGHQVRMRGFTYEVTVQVCSMDDPKDDLGRDDGTIDFCPESQAASAGNEKDRNPDDYRRISVTLEWTRGNSSAVEDAKQTSIVPNPIGGLGPSIADLVPQGIGSPPYTVTTSVSSIDFEVTTSTSADTVNWLVAGSVQGDATQADGTGKRWDFTWNLDSPEPFHDCTWVVGTEAFDADGRSGAPKSVTVTLNRSRPPAPTGFEGGRNGNSSPLVHMVDLEWQQGPECDVLGYQVFREIDGTNVWTQIQCMGQAQPEYHELSTCLDETAPGLVNLRYRVRAVDTLPTGGLGAGTFTSPLSIAEGNNVPDPPTGLVACVGGTAGCNEANGEPASDGVTVLSWTAPQNPDDDGDAIYFYRIYRDGQTYADRVAAYVHGPGTLAWADPDTPDTDHDYCVTAVDERFAESACSASILNFP
jgi:prepilin-type N-terminal cleavage/methylation domain-containing protein